MKDTISGTQNACRARPFGHTKGDSMQNTEKHPAENQENSKTKITSRQVVAMTGVVLLVLLYLLTLLLAVTDNSASGQFFAMSLCGTLILPIIIFLYSWMYGRITGRGTVGDPERIDPASGRPGESGKTES